MPIESQVQSASLTSSQHGQSVVLTAVEQKGGLLLCFFAACQFVIKIYILGT